MGDFEEVGFGFALGFVLFLAEGVDAIAKTYKRDKERLEAVKMDSDIWLPLMEKDSGGYMSQWGLPFLNPEGKMWFYDSDKKAKIPFTDKNILADPRTKELLKREEVMKEAELKNPGDQNAAEYALDDYLLKQAKRLGLSEHKDTKKDDDDSLNVTVKVPGEDKTGSGRATDTGGLLEVQRRKMDQLMKDAEKNKLPEEDKEKLTTDLKGEGVKTKGLTDKNMLLIAMGLGMMASDKPGLQGVGAGALTGIKTVLPLMEKKASDFQIVEVADPKNPGQTKLVKINKKTNETTDLGLGGKGTEIASIKLLKFRADKLKIPVDQLIILL